MQRGEEDEAEAECREKGDYGAIGWLLTLPGVSARGGDRGCRRRAENGPQRRTQLVKIDIKTINQNHEINTIPLFTSFTLCCVCLLL